MKAQYCSHFVLIFGNDIDLAVPTVMRVLQNDVDRIDHLLIVIQKLTLCLKHIFLPFVHICNNDIAMAVSKPDGLPHHNTEC